MKNLSGALGLALCLFLASRSSGTYLTPYTPSTSPTVSTSPFASTTNPPQTTTAKPPTTSVNAEKAAILTFTIQALWIEGKRAALVNFYAPLLSKYAMGAIISKTFLDGVPPNYFLLEAPPSGLEGMTALRQKMILLSCPQSMQSI
jgi:hypothetical protein